MKTLPLVLRLLLATAALGTAVSFAEDEPGVERWTRGIRIDSFTAARKVVAGDLVMMRCKGCKSSVNIIGNYGDAGDESRSAWHTIGATQTCSECTGQLTVARGKDADDMKIHCSKCGEDSVRCLVAPAEKKE